jgi:hypothetical protein
VSGNTIITVALVIAALLLAVMLFVAGAMWRGRVTSERPGRRSCDAVRQLLLPRALSLPRCYSRRPPHSSAQSSYAFLEGKMIYFRRTWI